MKTFTITTGTTETLKTDVKGHAKVVFTVTNASRRPVRGLASLKGMGDTKREWLSIAGDNERDFGGGTTEQFTVEFDAASAPAGKYPFRLNVASFSNPDDDFTEGPNVTLEVPARALPPDERKFPIWLIIVIAVIGLSVGSVLIWLFSRNKTTEQPLVASSEQPLVASEQTLVASYKLPDVEDTGEAKAKQRLEEGCAGDKKPCVAVEVQPVVDERIAKDRVIRTEPVAGTEVPLGSKVVLFTSLGPLVVPGVANQPAAAAEERLRAMCGSDRCAVVVQQLNDDRIAKDTAIGTEPGENSKLKLGATVTLFISSGPELIRVGNYTNMPPDAAKAQIIKDGFTVGEVNVVIVRDHRRGAVPITAPTVWGQAPGAGTPTPKGAKINLQIRER